MSSDILTIIGNDSSLKRQTRAELAGPCPFCGGNDRFRVNIDNDTWWCRQCSPDQRWHDKYEYIKRKLGVSYKQAKDIIDGPQGPQGGQPQANPIADYPAAHGCTWADFKAWGAEMRPFQDYRKDKPTYGQFFDAIYFPGEHGGGQWRIFGLDAKFMPDRPGQRDYWYGLKQAAALAIATGQPLVIVNGKPSVIACHAQGVAATTIPGGETGMQTRLKKLIKELTAIYSLDRPITVLLDGDKTGRQYAPKVADLLRQNGYTVAVKDPGDDLDAADIAGLHQTQAVSAIAALPDLGGVQPPPPPPSNAQVASYASDPFLVEANWTHPGNAECMAHLFAGELRFCSAWGDERTGWLRWNGNVWGRDDLRIANLRALETVRARFHAAPQIPDPTRRVDFIKFCLRSENSLPAVLREAATQPAFATTMSQYDTDPWLAACQNGTLDLRTGQLRPSRQDDYITMQLGVAYNPKATAPRWERFISEVFGGDAELVSWIRRAIGYSLTGDVRDQAIMLCYGDGANGKSVLLNVVKALLADYGGNAGFETFEAGQRQGVGEYLAMLRGKRYVTIIETEEDRRLAEAKVKAVSDGTPITCRFLHANPFTYRPQCKVWLAMNHKPIIQGTDHGIWRRVRLIPFVVKFFKPGDEGYDANDPQQPKAEPGLEQWLIENELPGILNWSLEGLREFVAQGSLGTCTAIVAATQEYRRESDVLAQWLDEECEIEDPNSPSYPQTLMTSTEAWESFLKWIEARRQRYTRTAFGRGMGKKFSSKRKWVSINGTLKLREVYEGVSLI